MNKGAIKMEVFYDSTVGKTEIARITTFATANRRDIVRRLMGTCKSFKGLTFSDAVAQYRYYESCGLVRHGDGYLAIYHDCDN